MTASTIAKMIEAHREGNDEKFYSYARFIADTLEDDREYVAASRIRNAISEEYENSPKVVLD